MTNLLAEASLAADVILPPTLVIDFLYLGIPLGLVAGALLLAAVVVVYRRTRRRGRSRIRSVVFGALTLFAGNLAIYLFWYTFLRRPPGAPRDLPVPAPAASSSAAVEPP